MDGFTPISLDQARARRNGPGLHVVEQSPARRHFPPAEPIEDRARVDVSGCLDGYRVWLFGRPFKDFTSLTNASRCAAALTTLDALDVLDGPSLRSMLSASVETLGDEPEPPPEAA